MSQPLEVLVGERLRQHNLTLALAESCTGGLVSHLVTNVPGSSTYYIGGVNAYSNSVKMRLLGVNPETLEKHGAVSQETVLEMARGVRQVLGADIGVSVSGIAGPDGGSVEKPVGTVWFGLSTAKGEQAQHHLFTGDRLSIKEQSAVTALQLLLDYLGQAQYD